MLHEQFSFIFSINFDEHIWGNFENEYPYTKYTIQAIYCSVHIGMSSSMNLWISRYHNFTYANECNGRTIRYVRGVGGGGGTIFLKKIIHCLTGAKI